MRCTCRTHSSTMTPRCRLMAARQLAAIQSPSRAVRPPRSAPSSTTRSPKLPVRRALVARGTWRAARQPQRPSRTIAPRGSFAAVTQIHGASSSAPTRQRTRVAAPTSACFRKTSTAISSPTSCIARESATSLARIAPRLASPATRRVMALSVLRKAPAVPRPSSGNPATSPTPARRASAASASAAARTGVATRSAMPAVPAGLAVVAGSFVAAMKTMTGASVSRSSF